jgi:ATP-dependent DNA helicase RecG
MNAKGEKTDWNELVQRESARVEWKENVANPQNVVKTLSAFANDFQQVGGGRVLCGLKEEKNQYGEPGAKVVGLDEKRLKEVRNKVLDYCHRYVDPPITPEVSEYPVESDPGRRILAFAVTSSQYAHRYRTKKEDVNYYIRINDRTRPADGLIPQLLESKKVWPPYLDQTHPDAALDAIDLLALKEFLGRLELPHPVEKYLEPNVQFRGDVRDLVTHPPGRTDRAVPRNFTILLFGREPHGFFRGAYAIFSVYQGKDKASDRSQRFELFGPIPELIRNVMARLQLYMGINIDKTLDIFSPDQNRERFSRQAVQEAIVNAFVHRDYHSYDPVRIVLFEDRIEVTSPGGPIAPIDPDKIRKGKVFTSWRNPSLAWFMEKLKFAQNEGQGIRNIIKLTKQIAGKEPEFIINSHWFHIEIPAYIPLLDSFAGKAEKEKAAVDFDITVELPALRSEFDELREALVEANPEIEKTLDKVEENLNEVTGESPKEKFNKPLNVLRRFLKKLTDKNSEYHKTLDGIPGGMEAAGKLAARYNRFTLWIHGLPEIPGLLWQSK